LGSDLCMGIVKARAQRKGRHKDLARQRSIETSAQQVVQQEGTVKLHALVTRLFGESFDKGRGRLLVALAVSTQ